VQDFRNLVVWRLSHSLTLEIYRATKHFPDDERFGLTSQIRRAVTPIEINLAEGCGRGSDTDFARFVQVALGSASEVDCQLIIAKDVSYLHPDAVQKLAEQTQSIKRMLNALLRTLRNKRPRANS
jgi:four helix bundle protein